MVAMQPLSNKPAQHTARHATSRNITTLSPLIKVHRSITATQQQRRNPRTQAPIAVVCIKNQQHPRSNSILQDRLHALATQKVPSSSSIFSCIPCRSVDMNHAQLRLPRRSWLVTCMVACGSKSPNLEPLSTCLLTYSPLRLWMKEYWLSTS